MVSRSHSDNPPYPTYFHFRRKDGVRAQQTLLEVYDGSAKQTRSSASTLITPFSPLSHANST